MPALINIDKQKESIAEGCGFRTQQWNEIVKYYKERIIRGPDVYDIQETQEVTGVATINNEDIRNIYEALPQLICGFCGYDNCGQFARAVAERKASPFGCKQDPWSGYKISGIIGMKVPAKKFYGSQSMIPTVSGITSTQKDILEEVSVLSQRVNDILARIEEMKDRKGNATR